MTRTLTLKNCSQGNSTIIENDFIDNYMAKANGEYVKVYLMLLRHLNASTPSLSISGLADYLECTEKDVLRAFKYWTKVGLLQMDYDDAGNICGLSVGKDSSDSEKKSAPIAMKPAEIGTMDSKTASTTKPVKKASQAELRQLYFIVEQYIGKPLSASEIKKINYFYDTLHFSVDLIEYLIEYCVENGHRTFRYIESVALNWSDSGIHTVDDAKQNTVA
jgi:DnaD/phage-associated family protein